MAVLMIASAIAGIATAEGEDNQSTVDAWKGLGAGIAVGLAAFGAGYSQANIGAAAVGMPARRVYINCLQLAWRIAPLHGLSLIHI